MQTFHVTDPEIEIFPHKPSSVDEVLPVLDTLEHTIFNIRNCFPRNDPTNIIE